ncbi:hypothetical protein U1Q18_018245 [Sarracenia purpurea var. burkii]
MGPRVDHRGRAVRSEVADSIPVPVQEKKTAHRNPTNASKMEEYRFGIEVAHRVLGPGHGRLEALTKGGNFLPVDDQSTGCFDGRNEGSEAFLSCAEGGERGKEEVDWGLKFSGDEYGVQGFLKEWMVLRQKMKIMPLLREQIADVVYLLETKMEAVTDIAVHSLPCGRWVG